MTPAQPPFTPDPFELELCDYLRLPRGEVSAGSFEVLESGLVRWEQQVDGRAVQRSVKMDSATLDEIARRATETPGWTCRSAWGC